MKLSLLGSGLEIGAMAGILVAYGQMSQTSKPDKIKPVFPNTVWIVAGVAAVIFIVSLLEWLLL